MRAGTQYRRRRRLKSENINTMIAANSIRDAGRRTPRFTSPLCRTPARSPPSLFECSRLKVKELLLSHLSADWTRIWSESRFRSYRYNLIDIASSIQLTLSFLSRGEIPHSVSNALALRDDLQRIASALGIAAPWTKVVFT